jgi:hypothetical protein
MARSVPLEATPLRGDRYAVRPVGALGTCGWSPVPWDVQYITAHSPEAAVRLATPLFYREDAEASADADAVAYGQS